MTFILQFCNPHLPVSSLILTAAFLTQTVCLDDTTVKFEIWDTAGQERYHSLAPMYYRGAQAAIVVYDITNTVRTQTHIYTHMHHGDVETKRCLKVMDVVHKSQVHT